MKLTKRGPAVTVEFDSLEDAHRCANGGEYVAIGEQRKTHEGYWNNICRQIDQMEPNMGTGKHRLKWFEFTSHPQLDALIATYKAFIAGEFMPESNARRRSRKFTEDDGEFVHERKEMDRPFEANTYRLEAQPKRGQIDLICDFGGNWHLRPDQLENAGLATCALVDVLEAEGYRTRVIGVHGNADWGGRSGPKSVRSIILKRHDEPLDIGRIGLVVATGAFFRSVGFGIIIKTSVRTTQTLGVTRSTTLEEWNHLGLSESAHLIPLMTSRQEAAAFVKAKGQQWSSR